VKPKLELLDRALLDRILQEAFTLLMEPGVKVGDPEAARVLLRAGARVEDGVAHIPELLARRASTPLPGSSFSTIAPATRLFTMEATTFISTRDPLA
jgi:trimethylamine:corrinoid methyltransferase-like protein